MSILRQFIQETEAMAATELANNVVSFREARAKRIKELAAEWADNAIELGQELKAVRESFPLESGEKNNALRRVGWSEWLDEKIGFSTGHAQSFIKIAEKFGSLGGAAIAGASIRVLDYLSSEAIPDTTRREVVGLIQDGEKVGRDRAKRIVAAIEQKAPAPEEARKIAKETGKPTLARDGNIYLGATKEQEKQIEARREMVFGVRHAIEALATVGVSPDQFLKQALPHQLWTAEEEHLIGQALDWLTDLAAEWERG